MSTPGPSGSPGAPASPSPLASPEPWSHIAPAYAEHTVPFFRAFAAEALRLLPALGARVLDVAAGPGTLALQAAAVARQVVAADFAPAMLRRLQNEAARSGTRNVAALTADGQRLPFADGRFDRAYSMFGLIFFPSRALGLAELGRVLAPGGGVAIGSWPPLRRNPVQAILVEAAAREIPGFPLQLDEAPLGTAAALEAELGAAGFVDVRVSEVQAAHPARSADELWAGVQRTNLPLFLLRRRIGEAAYADVAARLEARLRAELTPEHLARPWLALVASARKRGAGGDYSNSQ
jgi:SAM-dependent methyltransferase